MKAREIRELADDALVEHIVTARRDQFGLRMQHATGELENVARLGTVRRDIARALTEARRRGLDPNQTQVS